MTLARGQSLAAVLAAVCAVSATACGSGPTQVVEAPVEVLVAGGDSQYGTVNQTLPTPLHVVVRSLASHLPVRGRVVTFRVVEGDASITGTAAAPTDSTGSVRATVRLGAGAGAVTVEASAEGSGSSATFRLFTVNRPVLNALSDTAAVPGTSITLTGSNFSPDADQNVVLFSGVRGRVTAASTTSITVTVPACLPERPVAVTTQLGTLASDPLGLSVGPGGVVTSLAVGQAADAEDAGGYTCLTLSGEGGAQYLVVAQSASPVGGGSHQVTLRGLSSSAPPALAAAVREGSRPSLIALLQDGGRDSMGEPAATGVQRPEGWWREPFARSLRPGDDPQGLWDARLRALESELDLGHRPTLVGAPGEGENPAAEGPIASAAGPARVPAVGERRTFQVYRGPGDFAQVSAVARYVGQRAALFVDETAPAGGFSTADLEAFSARFDDAIYPSVTTVFGSASDVDGNDRIIILFTPKVNELTPRGVSGFIAGFFFGVDLLPEQQGSNGGEVFYSIAPDPAGIYGDPRPTDDLLRVTPAVLSHEFQHMVHFNERILKLDAEGTEATWLSEGLAQFAEEVVARYYAQLGDAESTGLFRTGVRSRSRRYLTRPDTVSLIVSYGQGTLSERGGGYLFTAYLSDRFGVGVVGQLTRSTATGIQNVEARTGTNWGPLLSDWWAASYLDELGIASGSLIYPLIDLRTFLGNPFPLVPEAVGAGDFVRELSLRSSAAAYYIVTPGVGESTTLRLGGEAGGATTPQAAARVRIVRVN